jgi:hypothetical protein
MRKDCPAKLRLRLLQATEEEKAAIRAMLSRRVAFAPTAAEGGPASAWAWAGLRLAAIVLLVAGVGIGLGDGDEFDDAGCSPAQKPDRGDGPFRYSLRHEGWCWVFECIDGRVGLKPEIGLWYVAWLLANPNEAVPCAKLFSRFSGGLRGDLPMAELPDPETGVPREVTDGVGFSQLPASEDEAEARRGYFAQLRKYREAIDDPAIPESERAEAQRCYDELAAFLHEHYQRAPDPGRAVTKLVHRSIRRLCDHLQEPLPGERAPNPVAAALGDYIAKHILVPSRRYTRAKPGAHVRIARGELAGRLIFECPPEDGWCVKM